MSQIIYKFKTFLPMVIFHTFDHKKLTDILTRLWLNAANYPAKWFTSDYDDLVSFGFMTSGNTNIDKIFIERKDRKPNNSELVEAILHLPRKYYYDNNSFILEESEYFRLYGLLNAEE